MTVISSSILTDFVNIQLTKSTSFLKYASGATFEGSIKDNQPSGYGRFTWSNSEYFEGFYDNGVRNKIGFQRWCDGEFYIGEFFNDNFHGWGIYRWSNNDEYEGSFYKDSRHGFGTYKTKDENRFTGTFYFNKREGYGTFHYSNGNRFQGLYKDNYRCGPGILQYADGRQDIGLWHRNSLLKLITWKSDVFSISQFPDLISLYPNNGCKSQLESQSHNNQILSYDYANDHILKYKLTKPLDICQLEENIHNENLSNIVKKCYSNEHNYLENAECTTPTELDQLNNVVNEIIDSSPRNSTDKKLVVKSGELGTIEHIKKEFIDPHQDNSRKEYIQVDTRFPEFIRTIKMSNTLNPLMNKIFGHLTRFSFHIPANSCENDLTDMINVVQDVVSNIFANANSVDFIDRAAKYSSPGDFEQLSETLISLSHFGNLKEIKNILMDPIAPTVNVTDCRGSFPLLEAILTWSTELINYLLDNGANINQITDEGITALGSCMLFYYPQSSFIKTIAESVVKLSQTPFNNNGVRREPMKNQISTDSLEISKETLDELGPSAVLDIHDDAFQQHSDINENEWDYYQKSSINLNNFNAESSIEPADNFIETKAENKLENKINNDNSNKFDSGRNCIEYPIKLNNSLLEKAASILSENSMIINRQPRPNSCYQDVSMDEGTARFKALQISRCHQMLEVIQLLLKRGANPNICQIPFSTIFFSVKSGDIEMTKLLISKGADLNATLNHETERLTLLHISACLPGNVGIAITDLLLQSGAHPNVRAIEDDSFLDKSLSDDWSKDAFSDEQLSLMGGKTPLHLVCSRHDDFQVSHAITKLLLDYGADPNLLCNGHTSLTLAIASGNDFIVDEILKNDKFKLNLPLTHGLGNALCVTTSTSFEHTRTIESRLELIKKLINFKADPLAPVFIGPKRLQGIAVDYAYYMFNLDQRVAHLPYHALTPVERDLFNNRRAMLSHLGMLTREYAVEKEKQRLKFMKEEGETICSPSLNFIYTGAGMNTVSELSRMSKRIEHFGDQVDGVDLLARKPLLKFCYECGRSVNVKLMPCTRCKEVYFCSKLCKTKSWTARHKSECLRIGRVTSAEESRKNSQNMSSAISAEDSNMLQKRSKSQSQMLIKRDPSRLKEEINKNNFQFRRQLKFNDNFRRLPPLDGQGHPSYSYAYIMGQYVKIDNLGRIFHSKQYLFDNYSFE